MTKLAVGIDIGGTNSKFGLADREGNIVAQSRIKTQQYGDYHKFIRTLKETYRNFIEALKEPYRNLIESLEDLYWRPLRTE